ncbi:MAG TPA: PAS domain-containing protein [Ferrovibrio sp.]|uniref:PAS domain-containing protein n=1 Tax=Ferrovibrio sp. TaxID=1917215 RepID=UPI002B4B0756|nr:PAS domain-containing protein [Ferrovibrio sp.]HLT78395.1 PAS domain-containing protein [Ferrovibrio sp.]
MIGFRAAAVYAAETGGTALNRQIVDSSFRLDPELRFKRPELPALVALWEDLRAGRRAPDRADFSPFVLRPYLPRVLIYEIVNEATVRRFRIRLYGTLISEYSGRDPTGKFVDETMSERAYADFDRGLSWVADNARPLRAAGSYYFVDRSFVRFESVTLPLTAGGSEIAQLLNVTFYDDEK